MPLLLLRLNRCPGVCMHTHMQDCSINLWHHRLTVAPLLLPVPAAAFLTQTVCLDDTTVKFEIWDTAGQERYHSLAPMYYRGAQAAIVVYDITNEVSHAGRLCLTCFLPLTSVCFSYNCRSLCAGFSVVRWWCRWRGALGKILSSWKKNVLCQG